MHRKLCYNSKNNSFLFIMMVEQEPKFSPIFPLPTTYKFISLCIKYATILEAFFPLFHNCIQVCLSQWKEASLIELCACSEKKIGCQKMHAWLGQENKMHLWINLVIFFLSTTKKMFQGCFKYRKAIYSG